MENNHQLPFLDIVVHRDSINKRFKFSIHRKPTNILSYIHFYSAHSNNVKISVLQSMFLRAYNVCSPEYFDTEIDFIYNIGNTLKYPKYLIDKAFKNAKTTFYNNKPKEPFPNKNLLVLPYNRELEKKKYIFKRLKVNVIFKNVQSIRSHLIKNSPELSPGCIYSIPCKDCEKKYIGQTSKTLEKRITQHKYSIRTGQESNAIFLHLRDTTHTIDFDNTMEIIKCPDTIERNIIESGIIQFDFENLINVNTGLYRLDSNVVYNIYHRYAHKLM